MFFIPLNDYDILVSNEKLKVISRGPKIFSSQTMQCVMHYAKPDVVRIIGILQKIGEIRTDELREELKIEI